MPCYVEYRWGSPVQLDILRCVAAAILEDHERRNLESAPDFHNRIMGPGLHDPCISEGKIRAPAISCIGCNWHKTSSSVSRTQTSI